MTLLVKGRDGRAATCETGGMDRPGPHADPTNLPGGRSPVGRWRARWAGLTDPERFRVYTRLTSEGTTLGFAGVMLLSVQDARLAPALALVAIATVLCFESRPELSTWIRPAWRLPVRLTGAGLLVAVAISTAAGSRTTTDGTLAEAAGAVGIFALLVLVASIVTFLRHRWWLVIGIGIGAGMVYRDDLEAVVVTAAFVIVVNVFMVALTLLSLWGVHVVDDLERARHAESEVKLAQERLRFARDLHDVVGRGFSAVAVKSELAATLTRAGEHDRAEAEMREVNSLAVRSMEQMRTLVRGYRDITLASEVAGARSFLSAAGCHLAVEGSAAHVPRRFHEVAAWVVREGVTNIVKHTSATRASLSMSSGGMTLSNDDAGSVGPPRSGHTGLAERLDAVGATMTSAVEDGQHILRVRWECP